MAESHPNGTREQIQLAGPSLLPAATAIGIATALIGLTLVNPGKVASWLFVAVGGLIALVAAVRWIGTVRERGRQPPGRAALAPLPSGLECEATRWPVQQRTMSRIESTPTISAPSTTSRWRKPPSIIACAARSRLQSGAAEIKSFASGGRQRAPLSGS